MIIYVLQITIPYPHGKYILLLISKAFVYHEKHSSLTGVGIPHNDHHRLCHLRWGLAEGSLLAAVCAALLIFMFIFMIKDRAIDYDYSLYSSSGIPL
jgi:hypothetical protein